MNLRFPAIAAAGLAAAAVAAPAAHAASTTVVISQVAFRGPTGGNDEMIQIQNVSATAQTIGGWQVWGSNNTGSATSARATVPTGTSLPAGKSFLFTNNATGTGGDYSGSVPGDVQYSTGISDNGGVQLRDAAGTVVDAVGSNQLSAGGTAYREGAGLNFPTANGGDAFIRKSGGTQDTDDNGADFTGPAADAPQDCGSACAPVTADPCAGGANGITDITAIQSLVAISPCEGKTVKIRGIVTGIDDLYGSSDGTIYKADSGIWVQEATLPAGATDSDAVFVAGIARDAANPSDVIGDDVTVTGKVVTLFGLTEVVPAAVGSPSSPAAVTVPLATAGTINSTGNPLPAAVNIDHAAAAAQDPATRPYYRSLQGMRVKLDDGIADAGGTTKFRDVYLEPGETQMRLFRQNTPTAEDEPWLDHPEEIGIAPDAGAGNPADPDLEWRSKTEVDLDLFDIARNVVGPLTYTFDFYEIMPQLPVPGLNDGEQPSVQRGPINAAYPEVAPPQPDHTLRLASYNVENYFPAGEVNDGHTITPAEYAAKTQQIVDAIHNWLRDPDVVDVQEVAVFADGSNALTGLAQALGDYTPYIAVNNDQRGIAPGFLIKNGVGITASNPRILGKPELYDNWSEGTCDLSGGPLFDRAPFTLDVKKGDLDVTILSNHWASQSHQEPCRVAEAEYVRQQAVALQQAGRNVIVAGDLNDFENSDSLNRLQMGGTLTDLWSMAPADNRYSYAFDGHLQTLDHVLVTAGLESRVTDVRYIHFDNDVYERDPGDGSGESDHDPPLVTFQLAGSSTSTNGDVTGNVPATLALTLGPPASFGSFIPGVGTDYTASTTATITSTAGDATLSVLDASATAPGHLVNGTFALAQPLQAKADGGAFAPLRGDNGPLTLESWTTPLTSAPVALGFKQTIGAGEALRTGAYAKTLTFTLSTDQP